MSGRKHAGPKLIHEAWLLPDSLTFITVDDAWDMNWVEGPPTAADLTKRSNNLQVIEAAWSGRHE